MIENITIIAQRGGVRLDAALLTRFPTSSRAFIRDAIDRSQISVNGRATAKGLKLKGGERIEIERLLEKSDNTVLPDQSIGLTTVFEDDDILAFDKPAGVPVQPLDCRETGTLMNSVVASYPECRDVGDKPLMAGALHRIDADTSGLVIAARNQTAFDRLRKQFSEQTVEKTYLALVEGSIAVGGTLENDLAHDPTLNFCRMIDVKRNRLTEVQRSRLKPLHAVTRFEPIGRTTVECEERTLLKVTIFTGVTHQIRAQLAMAGHHIVNDTLYGAFAEENRRGHCLHALGAAFIHPTKNAKTAVSTRYPDWADV